MKRKSNLSEELYRMRKLMGYDSKKDIENITSYDRLIEETLVKKTLLKEQVSQTDVKYTELLMPTEEQSELFPQQHPLIKKVNNLVKGEEGGEENAIKRRIELENTYGDTYKKLLLALSKSPNKVNNGKFWFLFLTQETRKDFLTKFSEWVNSKEITKIVKKKPDKVQAKIVKGKINKETEKGEISSPEPQSFMFDLEGKNTFIDNVSDISPDMKIRIDDFIKEITPKVQLTLNRKGVVTCDKIDVAASSSRFRNTEGAKDLTWAQLSEQRANKVYEEIYRRLSELGVKFKDNHKVLRGGENGDGTSGPNPGKNDEGQQYTISKDGTYENTLKTKNEYEENINKYGEPHNTKEEYDQYKFCIVNVEVSGFESEDPDPFVNVVTSREYSIEFKIGEDLGKSKVRKFKPTTWTTPSNRGKKGPSLTDCPIFGG
jgi:hypothetical protein